MDPDINNVKSVRRSKEEKKVLRKQLKASHTLLKHEGINTSSHPTKSLVVANGGLGNGVSREELSAALKEMGQLETLVMQPHKPYAFVTYRSEDCARKAHVQLNGEKILCGESSVTLYLSFVNSVPSEEEASVPLPQGLVLVEDFVSLEEETQLLTAVDWSSAKEEEDDTAQKALKHRRVKHYGFEFRYDNNNVDKDKPLAAGIPPECLPVLERCVAQKLLDSMPDQLTVNQYESGQGIPPHVDTHSAFEDTIMSLSLGAQTVMEFRHPDGRLVPVLLPGRSLLLMKGESRYLWSHGITPRKFDTVPSDDPQSSGSPAHLTLTKRGTRTSFTFRRIRHEPCCCAFPSACDSQKASGPCPPSLPSCHSDAAHLEEEYVHRVYNAIASHFSGTRHSPWPRVCHFLNSLSPGSLLADVGCGNGKYLGVNPQLVALGCDRSSALVQICEDRGFQAFVSDALSLPLRSASFDACISIAVIHHFSTQERRLAAVRELVRLLKLGGQALIYVWAFEQEHNKLKSKYLKDQKKEPGGVNLDLTIDKLKESPEAHRDTSCHLTQRPTVRSTHVALSGNDGKLGVHTNRTAFNTQDLLVPWHLKGEKKQGGKESGEAVVKEKRKGSVRKTSEDRSLVSSSSSVDRIDCNRDRTQDLDSGMPSGAGLGISNSGHNSDSEPQLTIFKSDSEHSSPHVFHRYYHVFQQGELEQLCDLVAGVKLLSSYHDQGNWCVILEKVDC